MNVDEVIEYCANTELSLAEVREQQSGLREKMIERQRLTGISYTFYINRIDETLISIGRLLA